MNDAFKFATLPAGTVYDEELHLWLIGEHIRKTRPITADEVRAYLRDRDTPAHAP